MNTLMDYSPRALQHPTGRGGRHSGGLKGHGNRTGGHDGSRDSGDRGGSGDSGGSSCSIGHLGVLRKRRHLGVLWKRGHLGEKSMVNPIWPVRLKWISRITIWIGFQTTYECSSKQIYTNQISCSSLLIRLSKYDQIWSNIHKNQIWADSLNEALECIMLQKIYMISVQFFLTFYSLKNPDKMYHGFHKNIKQHIHFATVSHNITFYCIFIGKKGSLCEHKNLAPGYLYYCAILTEADDGSSCLFSEQLSGVSCVMGSWALSSCCSRSEHWLRQVKHTTEPCSTLSNFLCITVISSSSHLVSENHPIQTV